MKKVQYRKDIDVLLRRYKQAQDKIDPILFEADAIAKTSPIGQPPPVLGRTLDKAIKISISRQKPVWEKLRNKVIPNSGGKSLWQEFGGSIAELPPSYQEIIQALNKYKNGQTIRPDRFPLC